MHRSPLRYPGGKGKIAPFMELIIKKLNIENGTYVEPFAGGAGIALELLLNEKVDNIVINDLDKGIYSFWRAILTDTDRFIDKIYSTEITINERNLQKQILANSNIYSFELGFAVFFLNRTNRSGILKAGPIGGNGQLSNWKMDARFNKDDLANRIYAIGQRKKDIKIYNKDVDSLLKNYLGKLDDNSLVYFDPPYYNKGKQLYMNYFNLNDHIRIKNSISENVVSNWIVTYDDTPEIEQIYNDYHAYRFDINYSVAEKKKASELMFFKNIEMCPTKKELEDMKIKINLR